MKHCLILVLLALSSVLTAQYGEFGGSVYLNDDSPAIGATVTLVGTDYATVTDLDGVFEIKGIKVGQYDVSVQYIGMKTIQESVAFENDQLISKDYKLEVAINTLEDIVVIAKSESAKQQEQAIQIQSIALKKVASQVKDLNEAIDQLAGVRVRSSGSFGEKADISLNGLNGTAVRTYVDGMPLEFIFTSASLGNLPLVNVSRIDVYKGVVPVDVGTDAMGGAVNVVTDYKPFNMLKASYSIGSFGTHQASVAGNYVLSDQVLLTANATMNRSKNNFSMKAFVWENKEEKTVKRFHDAYALYSANAGVIFKSLSWTDRLKIIASYSDYSKEYQHGNIIKKTAYGQALFKGNNKSISVAYAKQIGKVNLENRTSLVHEHTEFIDTTANIYSWSGEVIDRKSHSGGEYSIATLSQNNYEIIANRTNLEYDVNPNTVISLCNIYGYKNLTGRDSLIAEENDILTKPQRLTKNITGLSVKQYFFSKNLQLTAALKNYYFNLNATDINALTPLNQTQSKLGWYFTSKYNITDNIFLRGSYEYAYRIPTFVQFFGNGRIIKSNPNLKAETSNNYNIGLSLKKKLNRLANFSISLNGFVREQENIIFLSGAEIQQYINAESVDSKGIEAEIQLDFMDHIRLSVNATKLIKNYAAIDAKLIQNQFLVGTAFPNTPKTFGNAKLEYKTDDMLARDDRFSVYSQYKYVDEFNFINESKTRNDENWIPAQHRLDAGFSYTFPKRRFSIHSNVYNILDRQLFDNYKIPRPGRSYNIKIEYLLNNI